MKVIIYNKKLIQKLILSIGPAFILYITLSLSSYASNTKKDFQEALVLRSLRVGDLIIKVEVADTPETRRRGLMYRRSLPENHGMLFVFPSERPLSFWMKNTWIPLSIGFFNSKRELLNVHEMEPESILFRSPKSYKSVAPAQYALEMNKGWFKKNNIKRGTKFEWIPPQKN